MRTSPVSPSNEYTTASRCLLRLTAFISLANNTSGLPVDTCTVAAVERSILRNCSFCASFSRCGALTRLRTPSAPGTRSHARPHQVHMIPWVLIDAHPRHEYRARSEGVSREVGIDFHRLSCRTGG